MTVFQSIYPMLTGISTMYQSFNETIEYDFTGYDKQTKIKDKQIISIGIQKDHIIKKRSGKL